MAISSPRPAPASERSTLSVSNCRTKRARLAPSAERTANSAARRGAGQQKIGDVRAGDQQDQTHGAQQQQKRSADVPNDFLLERLHRFLDLDWHRDRADPDDSGSCSSPPGLRYGHTRLQARDGEDTVVACAIVKDQRIALTERRVNIGVVFETKSWR